MSTKLWLMVIIALLHQPLIIDAAFQTNLNPFHRHTYFKRSEGNGGRRGIMHTNIPVHRNATKLQLCGQHLMYAVNKICEGNFHAPGGNRYPQSQLSQHHNQAKRTTVTGSAYQNHGKIVEECCTSRQGGCTPTQLMRYCSNLRTRQERAPSTTEPPTTTSTPQPEPEGHVIFGWFIKPRLLTLLDWATSKIRKIGNNDDESSGSENEFNEYVPERAPLSSTTPTTHRPRRTYKPVPTFSTIESDEILIDHENQLDLYNLLRLQRWADNKYQHQPQLPVVDDYANPVLIIPQNPLATQNQITKESQSGDGIDMKSRVNSNGYTSIQPNTDIVLRVK